MYTGKKMEHIHFTKVEIYKYNKYNCTQIIKYQDYLNLNTFIVKQPISTYE